jgi:cytochrome c
MKLISKFFALSVAYFCVTSSVFADTMDDGKLVGDADRGRLPFFGCSTCHFSHKGGGHNTGPNLYGIFGREAGSYEDFRYYSEALRQAKFVWTPEILDLWLEDPGKMMPGTIMMAKPMPDAQRRADLIERLKQFQD